MKNEAKQGLRSFEDKQATMILMMLYPLESNTALEQFDVVARDVPGEQKGVKRFLDQGREIGAVPVRPQSAYTFDGSDKDRLFTIDHGSLLRHPAEILGKRSEVILTFEEGLIRWCCFIRKDKPRKVLCHEKVHAFYEFHCMDGDENGWQEYQIRAIGFNKAGRPLMMRMEGTMGSMGADGQAAIVAASIIEDAHRSGAVMATLEADAKITFPISVDEYKQFLAERDGFKNTPTGRRNSILHFCNNHARKRGEKLVEVKAHTRGARVFETGGMTLTLTPPAEWEGA
ncbi:MAG: hypothetical protein CMJ75_19070 [Planctomycetaceae bacterium]|nr:hypothetical protein [Planctomycetaceae bacterium]